MKPLAVVGCSIAGLALVVGLGWVFMANDIAMTSYSQPKYEAIRRNTFEQSKAYNQGMVQNLRNMQEQYIAADDAHKPALASLIRHETADYDIDLLPPDLRQFVGGLR